MVEYVELVCKDLSADNCHFPVQERVETRSCCSKEEDKNRVTAVPLTRDRVQTRQSKMKQTGPEKEEKAPARRKRKK